MENFVMLQLAKDEDIIPAIHAKIADKNWNKALIVAGAGSAYQVTVSNPISESHPPQLLPITVVEPCEVISFVGEISRKDEVAAGDPSPFKVHIHASFSHGSGVVNGGGFRGGKVWRAINLYVLVLE